MSISNWINELIEPVGALLMIILAIWYSRKKYQKKSANRDEEPGFTAFLIVLYGLPALLIGSCIWENWR